jgi:hypothetical protein
VVAKSENEFDAVRNEIALSGRELPEELEVNIQ